MADKRRIVILGAGYAGLGTALNLAKRRRFMRRSQVTLVDSSDYHLICTELHRVAAGELDPERIKVPIAELLSGTGVDFIQGLVKKIDTEALKLIGDDFEIEYDILVTATGAEDAFYGVKGAEKNSYTVSDLGPALATRDRFEDVLKEGREGTPDPVVIVGAGATGVEVAAYMNDRARKKDAGAGIILIDSGEKILSGGHYTRRVLGKTHRRLEKAGIKIMLENQVKEIRKNSVVLESGEKVACSFTVWAAGVHAREVSASLGQPQLGRRIKVLPDLSLEGNSEIFVLGDAALVRGGSKPLPCSAQYAVQMAEAAADNIVSMTRGAKTSRYVPEQRGEFISIGGGVAMGWLGLVEIWGYDAQFVKDSIFYKYLLGIGPAALKRYLNV